MTLNNILLVTVGFIVAALAIYMTPLRYTPLLEPAITDIDPTEFRAQYLENPDKYVFIDVRPESVYAQKHAEGSVSMPLHTLYDERKTLPKKGQEIILICSGGSASGVGYSYLEHFGFTNISRIDGGIESWVAADLPVVIDIGI